MLFILVSTSPIYTHDLELDEAEMQSASGRSVHYGSWVAHREVPVDVGCAGWSGTPRMFDSSSEGYIAMYAGSCSDLVVFDVVDLLVVESIEIEQQPNFLEFSPNGDYLAISSPYNVKIYSTSSWDIILDEDMNDFYIQDATWSGDSNRLVVATGNNGGHMYEGPDWDEVEGTTSNGGLVAHHPAEDKLWYLNSDGSGNVYEYQNVPLAGYQWVMTRSFSFANAQKMISSPDGGELLLTDDYSTYVYSTSDYTQKETFDASRPLFSFDGTTMLLIEDDYWWNTYNLQLISTEDWSLEGSFHPEKYGRYAFSSNDSEIFMFSRADSSGVEQLTGYMPDTDGDGVVDYRDECPDTDTSEGSNSAGCAPSQRDTDFDSINDRDDLCPRTKSGASIDGNGCSVAQLTDSDNDGVSDSDDECPNTPIAEYGNIHGCSSSQRDVDGDGFSDLNDTCPLHDVDECTSVITWEPDIEPIENTEDYTTPMWSPNGDLFSTFEDSNTIHILDTDFTIEYEIINQIEDTYFSLMSWLPGGNSIVVLWSNYSYYDSTCGYSVYALSNIENPTINTISYNCDYFRSFAINPDGNKLAVSIFSYYEYSGKLMTVEIDTGIQDFENEDYYPQQLEYSHDGTTLIGSSSGEILFWDTSDGYLLRSKNLNSISSFHQSPDGDWLIVSTNDEIKLYSFNTLIFKNAISIEQNTSDNFYTSLDGLSLSRSGNLIYASIYETLYTPEETYRNVTLHTYVITESNELEFLTRSSPVNNSRWMVTSISPDESMAIVRINSIDGFTVWTKDSDGDGLIDSIDECPDTSLDVEVNDRGCGGDQLDDDGDGLANSEDLCPGSPSGVATDQNGCTDQQVDEDFDGICNQDAPSNGPSDCVGRDQCPGSLSGIIIDSNGCGWAQQDSDGDGVVNVDDLCDDTEIAGDADENGCDRKQRDSDLDSVKDYWDDCEFTLDGDITDDAGCSDLQVDSDSDSICNRGSVSYGPSNCTSIDTCPNTGANETVDENGCSWNQRDDDGDGIFNKFDQCPDTLDDSVGPNGCSTWQADADGDGVNDANDECAKTKPDQIADSRGCSKEQNELIRAGAGDESLASNTILSIAGLIFIVLAVLLVLRRKSSDFINEDPSIEYPDYATRGAMREGREWIEYPSGSQQWFYRDPSTQQWVHRE